MPQIRTITQPVRAKLSVPGSKSITQRALLLGALADGVCEISNMHMNATTQNMIKALSQLGIAIQSDEQAKSCIIAGCNGKIPKKQATVWCNASNTVLQFLIAACSISPGVYYFDGDKKLHQHANLQLLEILKHHGVKLTPPDTLALPFTLEGLDSLEGSEVALESSISSIMISALLMIAPFARSSFTFNLSDYNKTLVELTCTMMGEFGVLVHHIHQGQLMVPIPQRYQAQDYVVEPDFTLIAYFFAAAAITRSEITIQGAKRNSFKQIDSKFILVLEKMGCEITETRYGLTIQGPKQLQGVEISMQNFTDTFLILSVIALFAKSPTHINHLGPMQEKELARMTMIKDQLIKIGIHVESGPDWLKIFPSIPKASIIEPISDPHIAMALSLIALKTPGINLKNAQQIEKICPEFFKLLNQLTEDLRVC